MITVILRYYNVTEATKVTIAVIKHVTNDIVFKNPSAPTGHINMDPVCLIQPGLEVLCSGSVFWFCVAVCLVL